MLGFIVRSAIVVGIFGSWVAFAACEIIPEPERDEPDAAVDSLINTDADPHRRGGFYQRSGG